jgi:hypothetical protein
LGYALRSKRRSAAAPAGVLRCFNLRGSLGRNTWIGPGLVNLDFSLLKNNHIKHISDEFNAQFRVEFFNIVNRANFAPPLDNRNVFDWSGNPIGNAGLITSTQNAIPPDSIRLQIDLVTSTKSSRNPR